MALISAISGSLTGAVGGGLVAWLFAPTRAEREERGRKRIEGRKDVLRTIDEFDAAVRVFRQQAYRREALDRNSLEESAVRFSSEIQHVVSILPLLERRRLVRRSSKIAGPNFWREAELRPYGSIKRLQTDALALAATAQARPDATNSYFSAELMALRPTDPAWDALLSALNDLRRRLS